MGDTTAAPLIYAALAKMIAAVGVVGKTRKNAAQGYQFRGIDDVLSACQSVLADNGVVCVPVVRERERELVATKSGGNMASVRLLVDHYFYAADGSHVVATTLGEAMDSGDKASNKAMSAALKYALVETLCIPTFEDDRDTEEHSPELAGKTAPRPPAKPAAKPAPANKPTTVAMPITESGRVPTFVAPDELAKEVGILKGLIQTAPDRAALDALTPRLKALPEPDRDVLRPVFNVRLGEVTKGAA